MRDNFKYFFEEFYPALCMFACKYVDSVEIAHDMVQEAFIKCWKNFDKFDSKLAVKLFLYTLTRNESLNYLKHKKVELKSQKRIAAEMYFKEQVIEQESYLLLNQAITELPPQGRRIIELALEGLKNHEIAKKMNISINTVKTIKARAYKVIRSKFEENDIMILFSLLIH